MSEEITAGGKEFGFAMFWAAGLYMACGLIISICKYLLPAYYFVGGIISILIFCVFGFFVMTRYSSRFTYTVKGGKLRINRMIGKRNKEIEFSCGDIVKMSYGERPLDFPRRPYNMRKTVFSVKQLLFIEFTAKDGSIGGVVIQPSDKLRKKIERERKKVNEDD